MVSIEIPIALGATETTSRLNYELLVKGKDGQPSSSAEVIVRVTGDGSLAPGFDAKEQRRVTDDSGAVEVTWYRRSIFGRNVKAILSAAVEGDDFDLSFQEAEPQPAVRMSWTPRRIKY